MKLISGNSNLPLANAVAIPLVAGSVWWSLRRLHQRVFHKHR